MMNITLVYVYFSIIIVKVSIHIKLFIVYNERNKVSFSLDFLFALRYKKTLSRMVSKNKGIFSVP